jgi:hypothetical protein
MFATLSYENRISEKMQSLGCSADFLSVLARVPASRLSHAFRGVRPLSNADGEMFLSILKGLEALVQSVAPVPVAFKNPSLIRELINDRDASKATAVAAE